MNLIYQYWTGGEPQQQVLSSVSNIKKYASTIGCEHIFERDPNFCHNLGRFTPHFNQFKIVYDEFFDKYDNVLFLDCDVFAVDGLTTNIFEEFDCTKDLGICREQWQTDNRSNAHIQEDIEWAKLVEKLYGVAIPRTPNGRVLVYNSGVVLYTKHGRIKMREKFVNIKDYQQQVRAFRELFSSDQGYLHAMLGTLNWAEMDENWNRYVHYLPNTREPRPINDTRTNDTKLVHIQLTGSGNYSDEDNSKIVNGPVPKMETS